MEFSSLFYVFQRCFNWMGYYSSLPKYMFDFSKGWSIRPKSRAVHQIVTSWVLNISVQAEVKATHTHTVWNPAVGGIGLQCTLHGTRKHIPPNSREVSSEHHPLKRAFKWGGYVIVPGRVKFCSASYFLFAPSASEIRFAEQKPPNAGVVGKAIQD